MLRNGSGPLKPSLPARAPLPAPTGTTFSVTAKPFATSPAAFLGAELAEVYPDAKVVILNRDPEAWYDSVLNSIYLLTQPQGFWHKLSMLYCLVFDGNVRHMLFYSKALRRLVLQYDHGEEKDKALAWYKSQCEEFRQRIPAERCIEYVIKDGWAPLCEYLGVPVPTVEDAEGKKVEAPFPRLNDRVAFREKSKLMRSKSKARANSNVFIGARGTGDDRRCGICRLRCVEEQTWRRVSLEV